MAIDLASHYLRACAAQDLCLPLIMEDLSLPQCGNKRLCWPKWPSPQCRQMRLDRRRNFDVDVLGVDRVFVTVVDL
jgi:hypothetical protein